MRNKTNRELKEGDDKYIYFIYIYTHMYGRSAVSMMYIFNKDLTVRFARTCTYYVCIRIIIYTK